MSLEVGQSDYAYSETIESVTGIVRKITSIERTTVLT